MEEEEFEYPGDFDAETIARFEKEWERFQRKERLAGFFRRLAFWRREDEDDESEFTDEDVRERAREIARAFLKRHPVE